MCPLERALSLWNVSSWESLAHVTDLFWTQWATVWIKIVLYRLICVSLWWVLTSSWKFLHHFFFLLPFMWFPSGFELEWVLVFSTDCTSWVPRQLRLLTRILASHQRPHFWSLPSGGKSLIHDEFHLPPRALMCVWSLFSPFHDWLCVEWQNLSYLIHPWGFCPFWILHCTQVVT